MPKVSTSSSLASRKDSSNPPYTTQARLLVFCHADERILTKRPSSYEAALELAKSLFSRVNLPELHTQDLDVCDGRLCRLTCDVWEQAIDTVKQIHVLEGSSKIPGGITTAGLATPPLFDGGAERHTKKELQTIHNKNKFTIRVFYGDGGVVARLSVKPTMTIGRVKQTLSSHYGISFDSFDSDLRLMFESRRLSWDSQTLQEIGIGADDELLILRAQCGGKPVIYVFSPQLLEVTVKLSLVPQWEFSHIYPVIPVTSTPSGEVLTWRVKTHENGSLTELNTGLDVSYLFWEAKTTGTPASLNGRVCTDMDFCPGSSKLTPDNSVLLPINSVTPYLDKVLRALGLHTEAVTSFITYWLPSLSKHAHVALRFVPQAAYEKVAPLAIIPTPDVVTRIFMLFKGIEDVSIGEWQNARERASHDITFWKDLVAVDVEATTDAKKYRVIEWGGMEVF